jgi:hypothetical protein
MYKTKIDMSEKMRRNINNILNDRLADAIDLQSQVKQAHWNVKGPNFIALHELFDKISDAVLGHIDEIAERVTTLGGTAEGTVAVAAKRSKLKNYRSSRSTARPCAPRSRTPADWATRTPRISLPAFPARPTSTCGSSRLIFKRRRDSYLDSTLPF